MPPNLAVTAYIGRKVLAFQIFPVGGVAKNQRRLFRNAALQLTQSLVNVLERPFLETAGHSQCFSGNPEIFEGG